MMKILIPIEGNGIAPRFDTAAEVVITTHYDGEILEEPRSLLIAEPSAESLCDMVLKNQVKRVICCGIAEEHHRFLRWKNIIVIDNVIAAWSTALERAVAGTLSPDVIIR